MELNKNTRNYFAFRPGKIGRSKKGTGTRVKIYLFRHGETDWNKARRLQGQSDIPLNEFGRELARKTAEALQDLSFEKAFCSPLCRAVETAEILLSRCQKGSAGDIPLVTDKRLMELHFGICEGETFDDAKVNPAHPLYNFFLHPDRYLPPEGGETLQDALARSTAFLQEELLPLEKTCDTILIVAHGAFNRCILNSIAGIPLENFWQIALPNCAASILSLGNGKFRIEEKCKTYYGQPVNGSP